MPLPAAWRRWGWLSLPPIWLRRGFLPLERHDGHLPAFAEFSLCTPLAAAYEECLRTLKLSDRSDPITEILAKKIIEIAQTGVRDSGQLGRLALAEIGHSGAK